MKKHIVVLLALLVALLSLSFAQAAGNTTTIMMYMCGTDLQSDCVKDLKEICAANFGSNVRVVVLAGGASKWDDKRLKANRMNLFTVENGTFSAVTDWGRSSMGKADTLAKFVNYAWQTFRSDRNVLVLWDHGGGSGQGICFDEVDNDDGLDIAEVDKALRSVKSSRADFRLDLLGCDACLMAGYEVAAMAANYADYFVASEELEPGLGWHYTPWLNALGQNPSMSTAQLGQEIVSAYQTAVEKAREKYVTLSVTNLKAFSLLQKDMEALADYLIQALENGQLSTINRMVQRMYAMSSYYAKDGDYDMYDLGDLLSVCDQIAPAAAATARAHLADAIVCSYASKELSSACGLSILIPQSSKSYFISDYMSGYALRQYIPRYVAFVEAMCKRMTDSSSGSSYGSSFLSQPNSCSVSSVYNASACSDYYGFIPGFTYYAEDHDYCTQSSSDFLGLIAGVVSGSASGSTSSAPTIGNTSFIAGLVNGAQPASSPAATANPSSFIAGTQSGPEATSAPAAVSFIAGLQSASSTAIPTTPTVNESGSVVLPAFIAGVTGQSQQTIVPEIKENDLAFSMQLSKEALSVLSYAEGALFMDMSDEDGTFLLDMGYLRNSFIDWQNASVYSTFDGTWPTLDGQLLVMYDCVSTQATRRSLVPVMVNGTVTNLVVSFENGSNEGVILGHNAGLDENGLLIRHTTELQPGDVITPRYTMLYSDSLDASSKDMESLVFDGEEIIWQDGMTVTYEPLADPDEPTDYRFAFYFTDIYGDREMSAFFPFTL